MAASSSLQWRALLPLSSVAQAGIAFCAAREQELTYESHHITPAREDAERYYSGHVLRLQTVTLSVPAVRPATHSLHSQGRLRLRSICASAARRDGGMGCTRARQRREVVVRREGEVESAVSCAPLYGLSISVDRGGGDGADE